MTSRESAHIVLTKHLMTPTAIATLDTPALDTLNAESAMISLDIASGNFALGTGVTLSLFEADASGGPFTQVPDMMCEWFRDGVPGGSDIVVGQWTYQLGHFIATMSITGVGMDVHSYAASYVGGQHRYIRLHVVPVGSTSNLVAALGILGNPRASVGFVYGNYPQDLSVAAGGSITYPTVPSGT